jgi:hypothetical protein
MKYAVEIGSGAMIYKDVFWYSKIIKGRRDTGTNMVNKHDDLISLLLFFFQNKESRLKMVYFPYENVYISY